MTFEFLRIADGEDTFTQMNGPFTDRRLEFFLGGEPESAFYLTAPTPAGDIIGYVVAGSADHLPAQLVCEQLPPPHLIHGPLVIVGVDAQGRHRPLTELELSIFVVEPSLDDGLPRLRLQEPGDSV